jgi:hypothetical protein
MPLHGPIAFAIVAADGFTWAHYCFGRSFRYPQMGPLHLQQLLRMTSDRLIIFSAAASDALEDLSGIAIYASEIFVLYIWHMQILMYYIK